MAPPQAYSICTGPNQYKLQHSIQMHVHESMMTSSSLRWPRATEDLGHNVSYHNWSSPKAIPPDRYRNTPIFVGGCTTRKEGLISSQLGTCTVKLGNLTCTYPTELSSWIVHLWGGTIYSKGGGGGGGGGTRYGCDVWSGGDRLFCRGQSGGTAFQGGTVHGVTDALLTETGSHNPISGG